MATKSDATGVNFEKVDPTYGAGRVSNWPQDSLGAYRFASFTGLLTGLAANAEIFQARWTDASNIAVIKFLKVRYTVITGFTAAQELAFDALQATGFSVAGTGGTQVLPTAGNLMKRSTYPQSKIQELRIATTAALGAGTKTLFGSSVLASAKKTLAAAATVQDADFEETLDFTSTQDDPIILAANEGLVVRNSILMGAAGTVRASIQLAWSEFANADYPSL